MTQPIITLQSSIISIKVPIIMKRWGGRKMIILPDTIQPALMRHTPDETLLKALARAYFWQKQLDKGKYDNIEDLAQQNKINSSYVSRILRLNLLAPPIKSAILNGTQPRTLSLQDMQKAFPDIWTEQLALFGFSNPF